MVGKVLFLIWAALVSAMLVILTISVHFYFKLFLLKLKFKGVWMPFHLPVIGIGHLFTKRAFYKVLMDMHNFSEASGVIKIGPIETYITADINEIKAILYNPNCIDKNSGYKLFSTGISKSLLAVPADIWKQNRKIISKCFNPQLLDTFIPCFSEKSHKLLGILETEKMIDVFEVFGKFTYNCFYTTTLGIEDDSDESSETRITQLFTNLQQIVFEKFRRPWEYLDFLYSKTQQNLQVNCIVEELRNIVRNIIRTKKSKNSNFSPDFTEAPKRKFVMDFLLEIQEENDFTEDDIIDEALLFVIAATDSTAITISFLCGLIGMHPEIQEKLYNEIIEVLGTQGEISALQMSNLKYLQMVLNETLRIFPPAPAFGRRTSKRVNIGTRVLDKEMDVLILPFAVHRDPKIYPDPLKFIPERFVPEEIAKRSSAAFIPFSLGPRNCIGMRYAHLIVKTAVINIVRNFKIVTEQTKVEDINLIPSILTVSDNLRCKFILRN